jgi:hypothetical protein
MLHISTMHLGWEGDILRTGDNHPQGQGQEDMEVLLHLLVHDLHHMLHMHMGMEDQGEDVLLVFHRHWVIQMVMVIIGCRLLWARGFLQGLGEAFLLVLASVPIIHQIVLVAHLQVVDYPMGSIP